MFLLVALHHIVGFEALATGSFDTVPSDCILTEDSERAEQQIENMTKRLYTVMIKT